MRNPRRSLLGSLAMALTLVAPAGAFGQTRDELASNPKLFMELATKTLHWNEPAEPMKVVGPIYFVGTKGLAAWLITTNVGHILLNTGMPPSGEMIEASVRKLGFDPQDIQLLIVSHGHVDHVGALAYIQRISGARVLAMEPEVALLTSGGADDFQYGQEQAFRFEPVRVDRALGDRSMVRLGDVFLTARRTPGHTQGATTWTAYVMDGPREYLVVFPDGTSINPGYRVAGNPSYPGIAEDYARTFRILSELKPDVWLTPHTEVFDFEAKRARAEREGARAWVDPKGYKAWVAAQRAAFEAELAKGR